MSAPVLVRQALPGRSYGSGGVATASFNATATVGTGVTYLVAVVFYGVHDGTSGSGGSAGWVVTDSNGNSYTLDKEESSFVDGLGLRVGTAIFHCSNVSALAHNGTVTVTRTAGNMGLAVQCMEWSGLSGLKDGTAVSGADDDGSATTGTLTTTTGNDTLLFAAHGFANATDDTAIGFTPTVMTAGFYDGFVALENGPFGNPNPTGAIGLNLAYKDVTIAAGYQALGAYDTACLWSACMVAYKTATPSAVLRSVSRMSLQPRARAVLRSVTSMEAGGGVLPPVVSVASGQPTTVSIALTDPLFGLFEDLSVIVGRIKAIGNYAAANNVSDRQRLINGVKLKQILEGIYATYDGFGQQFTGMRNELAAYADARLLDRDRVLRPLGLTSASIDDVLDRLGVRMLEQGVTIARSTVTIGPVGAGNRNVGTGTIYTTKVLDGVTAPGEGASRSFYRGLDSELALKWERMNFICTADSANDGLPEGSESFSWSGNVRANDALTWELEGSGDGPTLTVAGAAGILDNGDFVDWTGDGAAVDETFTPDSWDIGGDAPTREATAANVYRGDYAALYDSTDGEVSGTLSQDLSDRAMEPNKRYLFAIALRAAGPIAGGDILASFTGTEYTAASDEKVAVASEDVPTGWTVYSFWITTPAVIPDDWTLVLSIDLPADMQLWVDGVILAPVEYHGGVGAVIVPGRVPFLRGDKLSFVVTNDQGGSLQDFFRRRYQAQLPSAASPTFAENLVSAAFLTS